MPDATAIEQPATDRALEIVTTLVDELGGRRPTSIAERVAAEVIRDALRSDGITAVVEPFRSYASFGYSFGIIAALAGAPALLPARRRTARATLSATSAALMVAEGGLVHTPLSNLLARFESRNVIATIEPRGEVERTLCLVAHLDSSRSGLLFHPSLANRLRAWIALQSIATLVAAAEPLLARTRPGRGVVAACRAISAAGLALLAERELRGVDVPGANDNASGAGVVTQLALETAAAPLRGTRLAVLIAGSEEAGLLGTQAFLRKRDTRGWLFLNFDGVGAPATLRYLPSEGLARTWDADAGLIALADRLSRDRPELGLERADAPLGLTYDATAVLARGGRALTLVAGDEGRIPNYHQPTDTVANLDPDTLARAIGIGRELVARIDRGEAD